MGRFSNTPPCDPAPRALPDLPAEANLPANFGLPSVPATPGANVPDDAGAPAGLPTIPVIDVPANFPGEMPDEADDGLDHAPWA